MTRGIQVEHYPGPRFACAGTTVVCGAGGAKNGQIAEREIRALTGKKRKILS
jgi:hypothetical protein